MKSLQRWVSRRTPWIFENSRLPVWLSHISPIEIFAFSFGPFVFCRDKLPEKTRTHEIIHYHQQLELLFVFQWLLYAVFWVIGLVKYRSGIMSYMNIPFEVEAYACEDDPTYLHYRPLWNWRHYL